ncbi:MAG TPA: primosomal protein N' [Candidatus Saccharimonadales bacterium]|nr:primosomal protein N' [Candidatus Saccharimonadales bacterium]
MFYYEVLVADSKYRSSAPLTYSSKDSMVPMSVVTVPLRSRAVTGFVLNEVGRPGFAVKEIKSMLSDNPLPYHCLQLAQWIADYYAAPLSEALRLFAPSRPAIRQIKAEAQPIPQVQMEMKTALTAEQKRAVKEIKDNPSTTVLLHGETGSGKTRVYLELARESLKNGKSVILLTPEISLTAQLEASAAAYLDQAPYVLHSNLSAAKRKQIWLKLLQADKPQVVIGPRSALFVPLPSLGLIVADEAHEAAYKQEQTPRYNALRAASQLGTLTGAKVIYGTATPLITDYYLADQRQAIVRMTKQALSGGLPEVDTEIIDLTDRSNFGPNRYLSKKLLDDISTTLSAKKQVMLYLNRRGSARIILCKNCGWQDLCPNCDVSLVYHADDHLAKCHICGFSHTPPVACPNCGNPDIIYKSIGTKALADQVEKHFPEKIVGRFDSDNVAGEQLNEVYDKLLAGHVDILVGTQLLAKGLDLPRLGLVGIVSAESSLTLPDYTAEERTFQLLYQVMGRVGRGHSKGKVIIQTYEPDSPVIKTAVERDYKTFYKRILAERRAFRFPPFSYLMKLSVRRATINGAQTASERLKDELTAAALPVEIIGPTPAFYGRRGKYYYYQLVAKSKDRDHLQELAKLVPQDWQIDLDPADLL